MSKDGVFSGPYFPAFGLNAKYLSVFSPNVGKYEPEKTPYLDSFHAVYNSVSPRTEIYCQNKTSFLELFYTAFFLQKQTSKKSNNLS